MTSKVVRRAVCTKGTARIIVGNIRGVAVIKLKGTHPNEGGPPVKNYATGVVMEGRRILSHAPGPFESHAI